MKGFVEHVMDKKALRKISKDRFEYLSSNRGQHRHGWLRVLYYSIFFGCE